MRLGLAIYTLLAEHGCFAARGGNRANSAYKRVGQEADGESLTVGKVRPNKNVDTLNSLNYVGCGFNQVNDKLLMAVSDQFFKGYNNCGREMIFEYIYKNFV